MTYFYYLNVVAEDISEYINYNSNKFYIQGGDECKKYTITTQIL